MVVIVEVLLFVVVRGRGIRQISLHESHHIVAFLAYRYLPSSGQRPR
jgi:hypothetical protein